MKQNRLDGRNRATTGLREVDLHLKQGYAGNDAIDRQLACFRGELDSAIRAGNHEIVFVHGQGSGRLRDEIRQIIAGEYPDCVASDASFARYGYGGATLVIIKKK
jgi:hypothetical protein